MYWVTGILGLVLAVAPWIFTYSDNTPALWASLLVGGATLVLSIIEGVQADHEQWEYWTVAVLGIAAIIAPFTLGFNGYASAMWTNIALGVLIAVFAATRLGSRGLRT